ncbi:MAG: oligosaccharide flippase family protein [Nitrospinae bacterium]|nr:oligosaccharide flippase family protein [Nitrospinota bacterium]
MTPTPARRMGVNVGFKAATELINRLLSFVFYMALARWLGESDFGLFNLLYAVGAMAVLAIDPGVNLSLIRLAPRRPGFLDRMAGAALGLKLSLLVPTLLLCVAYGWLAGYDPSLIALLTLMGVNMAGFALTEYAAALMQARERMGAETWLMGLGKTVVTGAALLALALDANLTLTLAAMTVAQVGAAWWTLRWVAAEGAPVAPRIDFGRWKELLTDALPLAAMTFMTVIFYRIDVAVAPFVGIDLASLGHYTAGVKLLDVWLAAPTLIMAALFPTLSRLSQSDFAAYRRYTLRAALGLGALGLIGAVAGGYLAGPLVTLLFSDRFAPATGATAVLAVAGVGMFVRHVFMQGLALEGKALFGSFLAAMATAVDIALLAALVGPTGIVGMAWAKVVADLFLAGTAGYLWWTVRARKERP